MTYVMAAKRKISEKEWEIKNKDIYNNDESFCCEVYYLNKKKLVARQIWMDRNFDEHIELIRKSQIVVFKIQNNVKVFLQNLNEFCHSNNCYGLILQVGSNEIFLFPKLNYSDAYLIKDILQNRFEGRKINVILGEFIV